MQTDFILEGDEIIVDYIGKIEDIQKVTRTLIEKLNLSSLSIPHVNRSKRSADFMSYYDDELKEMVYEYYKRDFDLLGYD